jgi:hypothetical protein
VAGDGNREERTHRADHPARNAANSGRGRTTTDPVTRSTQGPGIAGALSRGLGVSPRLDQDLDALTAKVADLEARLEADGG